MTAPIDPHDLKAVKTRLDQIVEAVNDESLSLEDALSFYEEAVKLGMKASEIMEADLVGPADGEQPGAVSEAMSSADNATPAAGDEVGAPGEGA